MRVVVGLLGAATAQLIAFGMAGAGHGWITPFWFSMPLWILVPVALCVSGIRGGYPRGRRGFLIALALVGVALDVGLVWATLGEGSKYFWQIMRLAPLLAVVWLALFAGWQGAVLATLIAGPREEAE